MTEEFVPIDVGQQIPPGTTFNLVGEGFDDGYFVVVNASSTGILAHQYFKDTSENFVKAKNLVFISWQYALAIEIPNTKEY